VTGVQVEQGHVEDVQRLQAWAAQGREESPEVP
jgi:hypothetical protein